MSNKLFCSIGVSLLVGIATANTFPLNINDIIKSDNKLLLADYAKQLEKSWKEKRFTDIKDEDQAILFKFCYEYLLIFPWEKYYPPEDELIEAINAGKDIDMHQLEKPIMLFSTLVYAYTLDNEYGIKYDKYLRSKNKDYPGKLLLQSWERLIKQMKSEDVKYFVSKIVAKPIHEQRQYLLSILKEANLHDDIRSQSYLMYLANTPELSMRLREDLTYSNLVLSTIETSFPDLSSKLFGNIPAQQIFIKIYIRFANNDKAKEWLHSIANSQNLNNKLKRFVQMQIELLE